MTDKIDISLLNRRLDTQDEALESKLAELEKARTNVSADERESLDQEVEALHQLKDKLEKSRTLVNKVHELSQDQTVEVREAPHRTLGMVLIGISVIAACVLVYYILGSMQ